MCNWCSSKELHSNWSKMNFYDDIILTEENPDYYIIINHTSEYYVPNKTIYFQMEPILMMKESTSEFLFYKPHTNDYNNIEWHLSLTAPELLDYHPIKSKTLSTILSNKYTDIGHKKRVDFVKYLESFVEIEVFGSNFYTYKNYKKSLPYSQKDDGLFPYYYTFNAENNPIKNYFTEKVIDAILAECVCFYWGCPNIEEWIDPACYIKLSLNDFENDVLIIKNSIENNEWEKRIDKIRQMKIKIIKEMSLFPRIKRLLKM